MAALTSSSLLTREPHPVFPHQPQKRSPPGARVGERPSGADCAVAPRFPGRPLPYPTEPLAGVPHLQARTQSAALGRDGEHHPPSNLQPPPGVLLTPVDSATVDPLPVAARLIPATITFPPSQMRVKTPRCSTATESGSSNRFSRDWLAPSSLLPRLISNNSSSSSNSSN